MASTRCGGMTTALGTTSTATNQPAILPLLEAIPDPRQAGKPLAPLVNILFGMNGWKELAALTHRRRDWLARDLDLSAGLPDDEVLRRVIRTLAPAAFEQVLRAWTAQLSA